MDLLKQFKNQDRISNNLITTELRVLSEEYQHLTLHFFTSEIESIEDLVNNTVSTRFIVSDLNEELFETKSINLHNHNIANLLWQVFITNETLTILAVDAENNNGETVDIGFDIEGNLKRLKPKERSF